MKLILTAAALLATAACGPAFTVAEEQVAPSTLTVEAAPGDDAGTVAPTPLQAMPEAAVDAGGGTVLPMAEPDAGNGVTLTGQDAGSASAPPSPDACVPVDVAAACASFPCSFFADGCGGSFQCTAGCFADAAPPPPPKTCNVVCNGCVQGAPCCKSDGTCGCSLTGVCF